MRTLWRVSGPWLDAVDAGSGGGSEIGGTEAVITEAIAGAEGGGSGDPAAGSGDGEAAPEAADEAELAKIAAEWRAQNPNAKGVLNIDRHQAVLTRNRNQWATKEKDYQEKLKQLEWAQNPDVQHSLRALALADSDQKGFVELLMKDPRFAQLIALKEAQQEQQDPEEGRPGPNAQSPDGKYSYYDQDGLKALLQWERQKAVDEAKKALMEEFGPVKQEYEQRNAWNGALESQRKVLDGARANWKGFKEAEGKIKQALIEHPEFELHDAYRAVVMDQMNLSRDTLRKEILAELNGKKAAADTLKPGGGVAKTGEQAERTIEEVILASLPKER